MFATRRGDTPVAQRWRCILFICHHGSYLCCCWATRVSPLLELLCCCVTNALLLLGDRSESPSLSCFVVVKHMYSKCLLKH